MRLFSCYFLNGPNITETQNFAREWRTFSYMKILLTQRLRWKHVKCKLEEWQLKQPTLNCKHWVQGALQHKGTALEAMKKLSFDVRFIKGN